MIKYNSFEEFKDEQEELAEDLKSFDINKCNKRFDNFYRLHNLEVERLTGHRNLRSMAI